MLSDKGIVGDAVAVAAPIILITGAGGGLGRVLFDSGVLQTLGTALVPLQLNVLLPCFIAACLKTAQGSGTVAIVVTASIVEPLLPALELDSPYDRAVVVIAIGAGALLVTHVNDSFFWVVVRFSGLDVREGLLLLSAGTAVMGSFTVAFVAVLKLNVALAMMVAVASLALAVVLSVLLQQQVLPENQGGGADRGTQFVALGQSLPAMPHHRSQYAEQGSPDEEAVSV
jgi:hypothetical protein